MEEYAELDKAIRMGAQSQLDTSEGNVKEVEQETDTRYRHASPKPQSVG